MKRTVSIFVVCMVLFLAICGIGCRKTQEELPYHADLIGWTESLKDDFLYKEENRINIKYKNKEYNPDDPNSKKYFYDSTLPSYRIIPVTEEMLSTEVFESVPDVDLETEMILIVVFSAYGSFSCSLKNIEVKEEVLEITIKMKQRGSAAPQLICWVITLDKLTFSDTALKYIDC